VPFDRRFEHLGEPDLGDSLQEAVVELRGPIRHPPESLVDIAEAGAEPGRIEQRGAPQRLGRRSDLDQSSVLAQEAALALGLLEAVLDRLEAVLAPEAALALEAVPLVPALEAELKPILLALEQLDLEQLDLQVPLDL